MMIVSSTRLRFDLDQGLTSDHSPGYATTET
jgi:hypothetical protein